MSSHATRPFPGTTLLLQRTQPPTDRKQKQARTTSKQHGLKPRLTQNHILFFPLVFISKKAEIMIKVCSEIVAELIQAHEAGKDINLNGLKQRYSRKHKAQNQPKLVDIIAAIPEQYKAVLLPNLKAKPVRTASGVSPLQKKAWTRQVYIPHLFTFSLLKGVLDTRKELILN